MLIVEYVHSEFQWPLFSSSLPLWLLAKWMWTWVKINKQTNILDIHLMIKCWQGQELKQFFRTVFYISFLCKHTGNLNLQIAMVTLIFQQPLFCIWISKYHVLFWNVITSEISPKSLESKSPCCVNFVSDIH